MIYNKLPISVLIMTQNEEDNISHAIESVKDSFNQVVVTDSFSTDSTKQICKEYSEVDFYEHKFDGWAEQRNWMLENCNIENEIVFFLDADEWIDKKFIEELRMIIEEGMNFSAIYLKVKYIFLNKWLKYSYGHPLIKRIFKRDGLYFSGEGAREYAHIDEANTLELKSYLIHQDRKSFSFWINKHNNNAEREAKLYIEKLKKEMIAQDNNLAFKLKVKLWIRKNIWDKIPLGVRPIFYFLYRYFAQLGFLDGKEGFIFCINHALWYQMLIDIKIIEKSLNEK